MTNEFRPPVPKVCNDCPFRRKAMPGWLGHGSPESFIDCMQRDEPLPCHQTIDYDDRHWLAKWMAQGDDTGQMCAGALTFLANKLQHHPFQKMGKDHETVFSNTIEFVRHHREAAVRSWDDEDQNEGAQLHQRLIADSAKRMDQPIVDFKERKTKTKRREIQQPRLQNIPTKKRSKSR
jgi:hypothetical protein